MAALPTKGPPVLFACMTLWLPLRRMVKMYFSCDIKSLKKRETTKCCSFGKGTSLALPVPPKLHAALTQSEELPKFKTKIIPHLL